MRIHEVAPILRWPGGKRWLCGHLDGRTPKFYKQYYEPFIGSAAMFFFLRPVESCISDINSELIEFYWCLQEDWQKLLHLMRQHQELHCKEYYYQISSSKFADKFDRAARTLYLNRTCWNGLYRVNTRGEFNVPIGTKSTFSYDFDKFEKISHVLKSSKIECSDFECIVDKAGADDFVFIDPPYTVKHNFNGFRKYNESIFAWSDQVRLRDAVLRAKNRGAHVIVTNADHESIWELYSSFSTIQRISRKSVIASLASQRGFFDELLISINSTD